MNALLQTWNSAGEEAVRFGGAMFLQSSLLIALLCLIDRCVRQRAPAVLRCGLWTLVLVKLALPPTFALPTSLAYWSLPSAPAPIAAAATATDLQLEVELSPMSPQSPARSLAPPPSPPLSLKALALLVWAGGVLFLSLRVVHHLLRVRRLLAAAEPPDAESATLFSACSRELRVRAPVGLRLSPTLGMPAVCGLWRPVVVIPRELSRRLDPLALRSVFYHELIHLQRGDLWVGYLQTLIQVLYWWHPLTWLANAEIRRAREEAVDDAVVATLGTEAEVYPGTLLAVARHALARPALAVGLLGAFESSSLLRRRVERLLEARAIGNHRLGLKRLLAIALLAVLVLPMAGRSQKAPTDEVKAPVESTAVTNAEAAPAAEAPTQLRMSPELMRRYGLTPPTNATAEAPAMVMSPELMRRYGLTPRTNAGPTPAKPGAAPVMDPALMRRYGLTPSTNPPSKPPTMSPELMRRYGLVADTNAPPPTYRMDPELAKRYGLVLNTNSVPPAAWTAFDYGPEMDPQLMKRYGLLSPSPGQLLWFDVRFLSGSRSAILDLVSNLPAAARLETAAAGSGSSAANRSLWALTQAQNTALQKALAGRQALQVVGNRALCLISDRSRACARLFLNPPAVARPKNVVLELSSANRTNRIALDLAWSIWASEGDEAQGPPATESRTPASSDVAKDGMYGLYTGQRTGAEPQQRFATKLEAEPQGCVVLHDPTLASTEGRDFLVLVQHRSTQ